MAWFFGFGFFPLYYIGFCDLCLFMFHTKKRLKLNLVSKYSRNSNPYSQICLMPTSEMCETTNCQRKFISVPFCLQVIKKWCSVCSCKCFFVFLHNPLFSFVVVFGIIVSKIHLRQWLFYYKIILHKLLQHSIRTCFCVEWESSQSAFSGIKLDTSGFSILQAYSLRLTQKFVKKQCCFHDD